MGGGVGGFVVVRLRRGEGNVIGGGACFREVVGVVGCCVFVGEEGGFWGWGGLPQRRKLLGRPGRPGRKGCQSGSRVR